MTTYLGDSLELTAGLVKVVWGKGDSVRVLDVVNPQDFSDFINADLEDRKIPQGLVKLDWRTSQSGKLEALYVPFFQGHTLPLQGTWAPRAFTDLRTQVRAGFYDGAYQAAYGVTLGGLLASAAASGNITVAAIAGSAAMPTLQANAAAIASAQAGAQADALVDDLLLLPDTHALAWGQGGVRFTDSFAGVDFGLQYYTGFLRDPVYDADPARLAATRHLAVDYNRYHQAGLDAAFVLADFNLRLEAAWHQSVDVPGTDPLVRNPFASAVAGLDRTFGELSVNLQAQGTWIQGLSGATGAYDAQKDADELTGLVAAQAAYGFANDRAELSLAGSVNAPDGDWVLIPRLALYPVDDVTLTVGGKWFGGDPEGQLGQYAANSFAEVKASYSF